MNRVTDTILDRLTNDGFPYPVAIYDGTAPELGPVLCADAFDVPEDVILEISRRLNEVLGLLDTDPLLLPGAIHDFESADKRDELPPDTVWYRPQARSHARI
ncbi:MAG TPA: hypothetical protein VFD82_08915 [Planctomycetota bacterium]|nr:hypothetical protein [Planctomycetota bacterium]